MNFRHHLLLLFALGLAGCAAPRYGCKGLPDSPTCLSAIEAYRATEHPGLKAKSSDRAELSNPANKHPSGALNQPGAPSTATAHLRGPVTDATKAPSPSTLAAKPRSSVSPAVAEQSRTLTRTVTPPRADFGVSERSDDLKPLRSPSRVMRIWIAPWEDADGDLHAASRVYTELEPRRWLIGQPAPRQALALHPLQVLQREKTVERKDRSGDDDDGRNPRLPPLYGSPPRDPEP